MIRHNWNCGRRWLSLTKNEKIGNFGLKKAEFAFFPFLCEAKPPQPTAPTESDYLNEDQSDTAGPEGGGGLASQKMEKIGDFGLKKSYIGSIHSLNPNSQPFIQNIKPIRMEDVDLHLQMDEEDEIAKSLDAQDNEAEESSGATQREVGNEDKEEGDQKDEAEVKVMHDLKITFHNSKSRAKLPARVNKFININSEKLFLAFFTTVCAYYGRYNKTQFSIVAQIIGTDKFLKFNQVYISNSIRLLFFCCGLSSNGHARFYFLPEELVCEELEFTDLSDATKQLTSMDHDAAFELEETASLPEKTLSKLTVLFDKYCNFENELLDDAKVMND